MAVSALDGRGLERLLVAIAEAFPQAGQNNIFIPYRKSGLLSIHEKGKVYREEHGQDGVTVDAELEIVWAKRVEPG